MIKIETHRLALAVLIAVLVVNTTVLFCEASSVTVSSDIDNHIEQLVTDGDIPSLHTCVVSGTNISWIRAYGEETSLDTVFLIGSVQKVFTAISILQLYENETIDIDDDVNDYLPFSLRHPDYPDSTITIRMLLAHRSGLTSTLYSEFCYDWEGGYGSDFSQYVGDYPSVVGISLEDYLSICLSTVGSLYNQGMWLFEPGTQYSYSNIGYKVLNYILESQTNLTVQEYMDDNIFTPLHMNNTGFNASEFTGHHATPYTRLLGNSSNTELPVWNGQYMIRSTARDMGHLVIAFMNDGQFDEYEMLAPETLQMMFEKISSDGLPKPLRQELMREGYGLGMEVLNHGVFGHGGSTVGFTAEIRFNPETDIGYVRLSSVNAILSSSLENWNDIDRVTEEVRMSILVHIGMIPPFDPLIIIVVASLVILTSSISYRIWHKRKNQ